MTIIDFLHDYNIDFKTYGESPHVSNGWIGLVCPFCDGGQGNYGLGINLYRMSTTCWKCGPHSLTEVLHQLTDEPYDRLREVLEGIVVPLKPHEPLPKKQREEVLLPKGIVYYPMGPHREFLASRGFDTKELERLWGIGYIGHLGSKYRWRVFIPLHFNGKMISFTTRKAGNGGKGPRYKTAGPAEEVYHHKEFLYGEDYCRHAVIVCEGPLDVWKVGPGAVGTFGISFSQSQVLRLTKYPIRVICFDGDVHAQRRASQLVSLLSVFPGKTYRVELDSKDPGEASKQEIAKLREFLE